MTADEPVQEQPKPRRHSGEKPLRRWPKYATWTPPPPGDGPHRLPTDTWPGRP